MTFAHRPDFTPPPGATAVTREHPRLDVAAVRSRRLLESLSGERRTWFCGAYTRGLALHDDALVSGFVVANRILGAGRAVEVIERVALLESEAVALPELELESESESDSESAQAWADVDTAAPREQVPERLTLEYGFVCPVVFMFDSFHAAGFGERELPADALDQALMIERFVYATVHELAADHATILRSTDAIAELMRETKVDGLASLASLAEHGSADPGPESLFELEATTLAGEPEALEVHRGKVVLVVNVASGCSFTPQYDGLERLYAEWGDQLPDVRQDRDPGAPAVPRVSVPGRERRRPPVEFHQVSRRPRRAGAGLVPKHGSAGAGGAARGSRGRAKAVILGTMSD